MPVIWPCTVSVGWLTCVCAPWKPVAVAFVVVAVPAGVVGLIRLEPGICAAGLV
jgi:hypothetical protein